MGFFRDLWKKLRRRKPKPPAFDFDAAADYSAQREGHSVVIMKEGKIVFEAYRSPWDAETPHRLASGTKSFWGPCAMAAAEDGLFYLDDPVSDTLTEWQGDNWKSWITVRQLLNFTSGLDPATEQFRGNARVGNKFEEAIAVPAISEPGTTFVYGPSHLFAFGAFLERVTGGDPLAYLQTRILNPIGMEVGNWTRDGVGNPAMAFGAYIAPIEWIKFGKFVNDQTWDELFNGSTANPEYGLTFWLGDGKAMAAGSGKQRLYLLPSSDMIVVRQGETEGRDWSDEKFISLIVSA